MKTKDEIRDWLIKNAMSERHEIDLSNIDFGDRVVNFNNIKAKEVFNSGQQAKKIYNFIQQADVIDNYGQEAEVIYNNGQKAKVIYNSYQTAYEINYEKQVLIPNYNNMSKEELVKILEEELVKILEKQLLGDE